MEDHDNKFPCGCPQLGSASTGPTLTFPYRSGPPESNAPTSSSTFDPGGVVVANTTSAWSASRLTCGTGDRGRAGSTRRVATAAGSAPPGCPECSSLSPSRNSVTIGVNVSSATFLRVARGSLLSTSLVSEPSPAPPPPCSRADLQTAAPDRTPRDCAPVADRDSNLRPTVTWDAGGDCHRLESVSPATAGHFDSFLRPDPRSAGSC